MLDPTRLARMFCSTGLRNGAGQPVGRLRQRYVVRLCARDPGRAIAVFAALQAHGPHAPRHFHRMIERGCAGT